MSPDIFQRINSVSGSWVVMPARMPAHTIVSMTGIKEKNIQDCLKW